MKFDLRARTVRLVTELSTAVRARLKTVQAAVTAIKTAIETAIKAIKTAAASSFRGLRRRLASLTRLSPQSMLLQGLALAATALMVMLAIGGLQTIAGGTHSDSSSQPLVQSAQPAQPKTWGGLPGPTAQPKPVAQPAAPSASPPANKSASKSTGPAQPSSAPKPLSPVPSAVLAQSSLSAIAPPQQTAPAAPTNYGERYGKDIFGKPVTNQPLIVLHETVGSADSAINTFRTAHTNESMQTSYHSIIRLDGTIVYIVPPDKRAYGAGNSVFKGSNGEETVKTHQQFPPSVNNFAYHVSLETPPDGFNEAETHSGYTDAQYRSLAWLIAHTSVPDQRITTHRAIDRSGSRIDPRSFDAQKFYTVLHSLPRPIAPQGG